MLFVILLASQDEIEGKRILPVLPRARHLQLHPGRLVPPNYKINKNTLSSQTRDISLNQHNRATPYHVSL